MHATFLPKATSAGLSTRSCAHRRVDNLSSHDSDLNTCFSHKLAPKHLGYIPGTVTTPSKFVVTVSALHIHRFSPNCPAIFPGALIGSLFGAIVVMDISFLFLSVSEEIKKTTLTRTSAEGEVM